MSAIINLRGTNAAGKSTAVRKLIDHFGIARKLECDGKIYACELRGGIFVLGNYDVGFGEVKNFTFTQIQTLVLELAAKGDVVFEGFLWSPVFKASHELGIAARKQGHKVCFALMSTPPDVCVARAKERKEKAGNFDPVNASRIAQKHQDCIRAWNKLQDAGHNCRKLDHGNPLPVLLSWLPEREVAIGAAV